MRLLFLLMMVVGIIGLSVTKVEAQSQAVAGRLLMPGICPAGADGHYYFGACPNGMCAPSACYEMTTQYTVSWKYRGAVNWTSIQSNGVSGAPGYRFGTASSPQLNNREVIFRIDLNGLQSRISPNFYILDQCRESGTGPLCRPAGGTIGNVYVDEGCTQQLGSLTSETGAQPQLFYVCIPNYPIGGDCQGGSCTDTHLWFYDRRWCGDLDIDAPNSDHQNEQCDDGNTNNFDGCTNTCQIPSNALTARLNIPGICTGITFSGFFAFGDCTTGECSYPAQCYEAGTGATYALSWKYEGETAWRGTAGSTGVGGAPAVALSPANSPQLSGRNVIVRVDLNGIQNRSSFNYWYMDARRSGVSNAVPSIRSGNIYADEGMSQLIGSYSPMWESSLPQPQFIYMMIPNFPIGAMCGALPCDSFHMGIFDNRWCGDSKVIHVNATLPYNNSNLQMEACDDGNLINTDTCTNVCRIPPPIPTPSPTPLVLNPWWQTTGGDVGAQADTGTIVKSELPMGRVLSLATSTLHGGMLILDHLGYDLGLGHWSDRGVNQWMVDSQLDTIAVPREDFDTFRDLLNLPAVSQWPDGSLATIDLAKINESSIPGVYTFSSLIPKTYELANWGNPDLATAEPPMIILINGNLKVTAPTFTVAPGSFVMFIVSGDIIFDTTVNQAEGIYIADKKLHVLTVDGQFRGEGLFAGWDEVELERTYGDNTQPAEVFTYRPDLVLNAPPLLNFPLFTWNQALPNKVNPLETTPFPSP